jgi:hypothetical protein
LLMGPLLLILLMGLLFPEPNPAFTELASTNAIQIEAHRIARLFRDKTCFFLYFVPKLSRKRTYEDKMNTNECHCCFSFSQLNASVFD